MRLVAPALAVLLLAPALLADSKPDVREEILVVVNKHIITRRGLNQAVEQQHAALYRQFSGKELDEKLKDAREKTLQGLVDAFLLEDKGDELGSPVTDEYVRASIDGIKKENNFATDADLERALKGSLGIGLTEFMKRQKQQAIQQFVLQREVFSKVAVEDNELRAYYEDHKEEYRLPSRFRIRELVIAKGATAEDRAEAGKRLETIQSELKGGKSFEELARLYSTSPSKATGWRPGLDEQGPPARQHRGGGRPPQARPGIRTHRDGQGLLSGPAHGDRRCPHEALRGGQGEDPGKAPGTKGPERHRTVSGQSSDACQHPLSGTQGSDPEGVMH